MNKQLLALSAILFASSASFAETTNKTYEGKSDEELARELANPNTSLTSLKFSTVLIPETYLTLTIKMAPQ